MPGVVVLVESGTVPVVPFGEPDVTSGFVGGVAVTAFVPSVEPGTVVLLLFVVEGADVAVVGASGDESVPADVVVVVVTVVSTGGVVETAVSVEATPVEGSVFVVAVIDAVSAPGAGVRLLLKATMPIMATTTTIAKIVRASVLFFSALMASLLSLFCILDYPYFIWKLHLANVRRGNKCRARVNF